MAKIEAATEGEAFSVPVRQRVVVQPLAEKPAEQPIDTSSHAADVEPQDQPANEQSAPEASESTQSQPEQTEAPQPTTAQNKKPEKSEEHTEEDEAKHVEELISARTYFLDIKEKNRSGIFHFRVNRKKLTSSNTKASAKKKGSPEPVSVPKVKKKSSRTTQMIEIGAIVALVIGMYVAIDLGLVDIGWKPPFSIFHRTQQAAPPQPIIPTQPGGN